MSTSILELTHEADKLALADCHAGTVVHIAETDTYWRYLPPQEAEGGGLVVVGAGSAYLNGRYPLGFVQGRNSWSKLTYDGSARVLGPENFDLDSKSWQLGHGDEGARYLSSAADYPWLGSWTVVNGNGPAPQVYPDDWRYPGNWQLAPDVALLAGLSAQLQAAPQILLAAPYAPAPGPALIIPAPSSDPTLCTVYGYLETPQGAVAAEVQLTFALVTPSAIRGNRIIAGRNVTATTNGDGYVQVLLERNDLLTPSDSHWTVVSAALGWHTAKSFAASTPTLDLASIV